MTTTKNEVNNITLHVRSFTASGGFSMTIDNWVHTGVVHETHTHAHTHKKTKTN